MTSDFSNSHCDNRYQKNHNHQQEYKEYEASFLKEIFELVGQERFPNDKIR